MDPIQSLIRTVIPVRLEEMYFDLALVAAAHRGTCARRNVGAVLVANGRIREIGWNGMELAESTVTCAEGGCPRGRLSAEEQPHGVGYSNCIYVHAEMNVLENFRHSQRIQKREGWAASLGIQVYVAGTISDPCEDCTAYAKWAGAELYWDTRELGWVPS